MLPIKRLLTNGLILSAIALPTIANSAIIYQSAAYGANESQNLAFSATPLNGQSFPRAVGESFTLASSANVTSLDFYIDGFNTNQDIQVFFHRVNDNPSINAAIYSQTFNFTQYTRTENVLTSISGGNTDNINFNFSMPFTLDAGNYGVFLTNPTNTTLGISRFGPNPGCSGSDCSDFTDFTDFGNTQLQINAGGESIGFTGYASGMRLNGDFSQIPAVPEPSPIWMFVLGLPIALAMSRKNSQRNLVKKLMS
jgi:hypothetical protein